MLDRITPLILCRDEEPNIARTLGQLTWAREVVVVDSFSTDKTVEIARSFPNVRLLERKFDILATQWMFGASHVTTEWFLALDADYFVPADLTAEMAALIPSDAVGAYETSFIYAIGGHRLRASLYPPHPVLLRRGHVEFWQDGHAQRVRVDGAVERLQHAIVHDDRKSLAQFVSRQRTYMRLEAPKIRATSWRHLNTMSRLRKLRVIAPVAVLLYTLFIKRTIFDGIAGLHYTFERVLAELILSRELFRS